MSPRAVCLNFYILTRRKYRKTQGNDKYKAQDYRGAIEAYTVAIQTHPDPGYFTNRAAAYMMILQFDKVITTSKTKVLCSSFALGITRLLKTAMQRSRLTELTAKPTHVKLRPIRAWESLTTLSERCKTGW